MCSQQEALWICHRKLPSHDLEQIPPTTREARAAHVLWCYVIANHRLSDRLPDLGCDFADALEELCASKYSSPWDNSRQRTLAAGHSRDEVVTTWVLMYLSGFSSPKGGMSWEFQSKRLLLITHWTGDPVQLCRTKSAMAGVQLPVPWASCSGPVWLQAPPLPTDGLPSGCAALLIWARRRALECCSACVFLGKKAAGFGQSGKVEILDIPPFFSSPQGAASPMGRGWEGPSRWPVPKPVGQTWAS